MLELSTFQIDLTPSLAPDAAALLNITPDHLDRHGTSENYAAIKGRVFAHLPADGTAVIGVDDNYCRAIADALPGPYAVKRIAIGHPVETGVWAKDGMLTEVEKGVERGRLGLDGIGSLRGAHNWQNAATAYALARSQGLDASTIAKGLGTFAGLAHRMEQVARAGPVLFVNDSKATNADAAAKALASFTDIYWIVGGRPKAGGLAGLEPFFPKIARAYLIGEAADAFAAQLGTEVDHVQCGTLDRAIEAAAADARRSRGKEPVVLLSPACASYDQFANFEARGKSFRDIVMRLPGREPRAAEDRAGRHEDHPRRPERAVRLVVHRRPPDVLRPAAPDGRRPRAVARRKPADRREVQSRAVLFRAPSGGAASCPAVAIMFAASTLTPKQIRRASLIIFIVGIALMVATMFIGPEIKGAKRWLQLGFVLDPAFRVREARLRGAHRLAVQREPEAQRRTWHRACARSLRASSRYCWCSSRISARRSSSPSSGSRCSSWPASTCSGSARSAVAGLAGIASAYFLVPHVASRIDRFLNPASGDTYQADKALDSFLHGGWFGRGPGEGTVKDVLPDSHTDFIFAVTAEEYGLIACLILLRCSPSSCCAACPRHRRSRTGSFATRPPG